MASAVDSRLAYARLSAVATASRLPTATRGSNNSYTTSWDTTHVTASLLAKSTAISSNLMEQEQILNHRGKERSCLLFDADRRANVFTLPESDGSKFGAE